MNEWFCFIFADDEIKNIPGRRDKLKTRLGPESRLRDQQDDFPERPEGASLERAAAALLHRPAARPGTNRSA